MMNGPLTEDGLGFPELIGPTQDSSQPQPSLVIFGKLLQVFTVMDNGFRKEPLGFLLFGKLK